MNPFLKELVNSNGNISSAEDTMASKAKFCYPFHCAPLDITYGGGLMSGKIYELFGYESHGKSTFALEMAKAFIGYWKAQKRDDYGVLWIETESAFNRERAEFMGVDTKHFLITEAETIEDAEEVIISTLDKIAGKMKLLIVWDTIAAASTRHEMKNDEHGGGMMFKPRFIRQMFRKITKKLAASDSMMVVVNQTGGSSDVQENGVVPPTPGGGGLKFHASVRTYILRRMFKNAMQPNGKETPIGLISMLEHVKNKLAAPKQRCSIHMSFDRGLDPIDTLLEYMQEYRFVTIAGSWKQIEVPEHLYGVKDAEGKVIEPKMVKISYQSPQHIRERVATVCPHLIDWMNYVVYKYNADKKSPLLKIQIIDKVWAYEQLFFGKKITTLTEEERRIARKEAEEIEKADKEVE